MDIFGVMVFVGLLATLAFGFFTDPIKPNRNERFEKTFSVLAVVSLIVFIVGLVGTLINLL